MSGLISAVTIPPGRSGKWEVSRFVVSEDDEKFSAIRASFKGRGYVRAGEYTKLSCDGRGIVMSDTHDERRDHSFAVHRATGHILINGLGLGMVLAACLRKTEVTKATVIEIEPDVVTLVASHYDDPRVEIINASAFDYIPPKGARYGMVWHDIWDTICADNLPEMTKLKRKYGRRTDWQGCWGEAECRRYA